jgi:hypothetical protein
MYFRKKTSGGRAYLQIVESRREGEQVRQQVIATLGRLDELRASGQLERLLRSGARFAAQAVVLGAAASGAAITVAVRRLGPALVFERLWAETGCQAASTAAVAGRGHRFALERAVFVTVLHRLMRSGSDLAADRWRADYRIGGTDALELHHLYRAMAWLGEELPPDQQDGATPFAPRCTKDLLEENLFAHRRDLFSRLDLVFMDTTSLYFEGLGGQSLGQYGHSKDHRPDLRQMILAVLIDGDGRPVCSEMWPGNTADVTCLVPVIDRLRRRFAIRSDRDWERLGRGSARPSSWPPARGQPRRSSARASCQHRCGRRLSRNCLRRVPGTLAGSAHATASLMELGTPSVFAMSE